MANASFGFLPDPGMPSCRLSPCGRYRYELRIPLSTAPGVCLFILANPSTAIVENGIFASDPTVTRCQNFARSWGYGTVVVANVRAWRETNPKKVPADPEAIGPDNDVTLCRLAAEAELIVLGYGKLGGDRSSAVVALLRGTKTLHALGFNSDGSPKHPLYLRADATLIEMPR